MNENIPVAYQKLFIKFSEINSIELDKWGAVQLLGYFCNKYKDHYGFDYTFSFKKAPSSSDEITHIKRLMAGLTSDPTILKQYIDWIFTSKVQERKKKITTIAFIAHPEIITEFKFKVMAIHKNIDRSSVIPEKYKNKINAISNEINTYGDLCFLIAAQTEEGLLIKQLLVNENFDLSILDKIK